MSNLGSLNLESAKAAPTCPKCGHINVVGALICIQCYTLLVKLKPSQGESTVQAATTVLESMPEPVVSGVRAPVLATPHTIALYIEGNQEPLYLQVEQRAILGRYSNNATLQVQVDFTAYGAVDKGVSRLHAVIHRIERGLTIEDLGSSNGTWLNDERIHPNVRHLLKTGDMLRLGQLRLQVYFRPGTGKHLQA